MGKVSSDARGRYLEIINEYEKKIKEIEVRETNILQMIRKDGNGVEFKKIRLADENLNIVSYYILMNNLSVTLLGVKNEPFLNNARKVVYKVLIYLEEVVTNYIDNPISDYGDKLSVIESFDFKERYKLINKIGYTLQAVLDGFGENTKWKWSFVELEGRLAAICKNFINLKTLFSDMDPGQDGYEIRFNHYNLAKKLLEQAANRYREKYELSTLRFDDFKLAIKFLGAQRMLFIALNKAADAEGVKKKMDIWQQKLESDMKRKDIASKQG